MGSDDLRKKKRAAREQDLQRKAQVRQQFEKILIVCEGSKTEPYYFKSLKNHLRLPNIDIPMDKKGRSPISVVEYGQELYDSCSKQDKYDKVFCVFDRDTHASFEEAKNLINWINAKLKHDVFVCIESTPSFEYWYLLHFEDFKGAYRPILGSERKSVGQIAEDQLKSFIPNYTKSQKEMFERTSDRIQNACELARRVWKKATEENNMNPSTNVFELVEYLQRESNK